MVQPAESTFRSSLPSCEETASWPREGTHAPSTFRRHPARCRVLRRPCQEDLARDRACFLETTKKNATIVVAFSFCRFSAQTLGSPCALTTIVVPGGVIICVRCS